MNIPEARSYLQGLSRYGIRPGLERMFFLLGRLGNPERRLRVVHIAGTNGKGSTAAILSSVLSAAGYRVGLYTSPHLHSPNERLSIGGRPVPLYRFARLVGRVARAAGEALRRGLDQPTEFEVVTAAMYLAFAEEGVDLLVQETGLGGRLDATNCVERPLVTILTPIGLDHVDYLGHDLASIAIEKAAIVKLGCPVVVAPQPDEVWSVVEERASAQRAPVIAVGRDVVCRIQDLSRTGTVLEYEGVRWRFQDLHLRLLGRHQADNAACALAALEALEVQGVPVTEAAVRTGLAGVCWPGRLEPFAWREGVEIVLDVAHNPPAARILRAALTELYPDYPRALIIGMFADKDVGFLAEIAPAASCLVATSAQGERALPAERLLSVALEMQRRGVIPEHMRLLVRHDPEQALLAGVEAIVPQGVVCVTGSSTVVGPVRRLLLQRSRLERQRP